MNFTRINPAILMIVILVLLVLLSACANLGNMLVARGLARQREITIRFAVGAGRGRLVRQLMTENFLLATLGCAAGLFVGHAGASWLLHTLDAPPDIRVATDWQTLTVGVACIFVSALAFGLPAALHVVRSDHKSSLRRQILVGLQVAVSCLLLISSTVLTHGAIRSATVNLSFDFEKLMVVYPQIYSKHLPPPVARQRLDALVTRLMTLAGVDSVTTATIPPLSGRRAIETLPDLPPIYTNYVGPSYFNTMEIGVLRGRSFLPSDQDSAIVSESAARAIWPNQDPLGKTLAFGPIKRTIIGIVKDSGANLPADPRSVEMYFPIDATTVDGSALILRSKGDPAPLLRPVHSECAGLEEQVTSILMRTTRERSLDEQKDTITIIGSLGLIATLLATTGMFALVAFAVGQRKREIGIRMAIGARPGDIVRVLTTQHVVPIGSGVIAGTLLAMVLARIVRSIPFFTPAQEVDPIGFAAGIGCFLLIAVLATLSPVLRALRIDPSATSRHE